MSENRQTETVLGNLVLAIDRLKNCPEFVSLIPEVRVNLAYALPGAKTSQEVAAVAGRITAVQGQPHAAGPPALGASDHLARRIIEARKYDPEVNAAINFKHDETVVKVTQEYCAERGLHLGRLDRSEEPAGVAEHDQASMPWKMGQLVKNYGTLPRLFYESAGWGKEPLFLALGKDAVEVATIATEIARRYCSAQSDRNGLSS